MDKSKRTRKKRPIVVSRHGKYRFQTGLVTAHLLERGLPMPEAMAVSKVLREKISSRKQISTDELEAEIERIVERKGLAASIEPTPDEDIEADAAVLVIGVSGPRRLDRATLLRELFAAGVSPDAALALSGRILHILAELEKPPDTATVEAIVTRTMAAEYGDAPARRYQLTRWLRRASRPVVLFIGGATGTGKSTLATELAFRLGIRQVVSTDMIRETMRTVLSPEVVPGLHDHSFRGMVQGGDVLSDPRERVLAGFHQQAGQVAVGIRAVIRRALVERSHLIVEGTHVLPPFEQYTPPGAEMHVAGLVLAVPEEERHLARFPARARRETLRDPQAYLDSFQSVRWIHDDLLQRAEDFDAVVLPTRGTSETATVAIEYLSQALPVAGPRPRIQSTDPSHHHVDVPPVRTLFMVLDGLADEPSPALGDRTPLEAARIPHIEMLAGCGGQGRVVTSAREGEPPGTEEGLLALLGLPPRTSPGRGLFEAFGLGVALPGDAVVLRGNLATCTPSGSVTDRRAGRIRSGAEDLLAELRNVRLSNGVVGSIFPGHEHRVLVALTGASLSEKVSDTDPGSAAAVQQVQPPRPTAPGPEAARTADALRELLGMASARLSAHPINAARQKRGEPAANCVITRGAARVGALPPPTVQPGMALVAACPTALGVARSVGIAGITGAGMTGNLDTDIDAKLDAAADLLEREMLVVVHIKGTDIAAHDRRPEAKRQFIEAIDAALGRFLSRPEAHGLRVVITADHGTSSVTGSHMADPVPLLLATWEGPCDPVEFDERTADHGALGLLGPGDLSALLAAG